MSEDNQVKFSKDNGSKLQWATGIFYRKDGRKKTLASKPLLGFLAGFFGVGVVGILMQDTPTYRSSEKSSIRAEEQALGSTSHEIDEYHQPKPQEKTLSPSRSVVKRQGKPIRFSGLQVVARTTKLKVPPGHMVKAKLISGASNGPVRAKLSQDIEVAGEILIEAGAVLVGQGNSTEERLLIRFNQLVTGEAKVHSIRGQACDISDQIVGLKGSTVGNHVLKLAAGIGLNFAGGASLALQDSDVKGGVEVKKPSMKNALLNGAAKASLEQARGMMSDAKGEQIIIEVPAEKEFYVMFQGGA